MSFDGSGLRILTDHSEGSPDPAWSPDGRWLAYTSPPMGEISSPDGLVTEFAFGLSVIRPDGSDGRLVAERVRAPWTPDGKRLSYSIVGEFQEPSSPSGRSTQPVGPRCLELRPTRSPGNRSPPVRRRRRYRRLSSRRPRRHKPRSRPRHRAPPTLRTRELRRTGSASILTARCPSTSLPARRCDPLPMSRIARP